jgi:hypothetical protein
MKFFLNIGRALVAVSVVAITVPIAARTPHGTQQTRSISANYADCVVKKSAPQARGAIAELASSLVVQKKYRRLIDSSCMEQVTSKTSTGGIAFGGDTFFYTVADALIRKDYSESGPADFSSVTSLAHRQKLPDLSPSDLAKLSKQEQADMGKDVIRANAFSSLSRFGECAVRGNPEVARQLSLTDVGSTEERTKFNELIPTLAKCLEPGLTMKFSPVLLRGTISLNYFRLSYASQTASIPLSEVVK